MGVSYLWDTNTVIYYLQQLLPKEAEMFMDGVLNESIPAISLITEIELLCWKTENTNDIVVLKNFISDSFVFELDQRIKEKTIDIRKIYGLKLPDAIIAATALENNLTLISRNIKDFKRIKGLKLVNPFNH